MISDKIYSLTYTSPEDHTLFKKNSWLVILHASRIPPHVGLMINGNYNSLTIKERELNVSAEALLKTISQKKIEALFLKLAKHPVFSEDYQLQVFQQQLHQFTKVKEGEATCLSPLKLFFKEFYAIKNNDDLLFDFLETLNENNFISESVGLNIKSENNTFIFNAYTPEELQKRIKQEREIYNK